MWDSYNLAPCISIHVPRYNRRQRRRPRWNVTRISHDSDYVVVSVWWWAGVGAHTMPTYFRVIASQTTQPNDYVLVCRPPIQLYGEKTSHTFRLLQPACAFATFYVTCNITSDVNNVSWLWNDGVSAFVWKCFQTVARRFFGSVVWSTAINGQWFNRIYSLEILWVTLTLRPVAPLDDICLYSIAS